MFTLFMIANMMDSSTSPSPQNVATNYWAYLFTENYPSLHTPQIIHLSKSDLSNFLMGKV